MAKSKSKGSGSYINFDDPFVEAEFDDSELMKKCVLTSAVASSQSAMPIFPCSRRQEKKQRRKIRSETKGRNWFDMKAPQLTEDLKAELQVVNMRGGIYKDRFYKDNDYKNKFPKFFQTGEVVDSHADFYSSRIPRKQRKRTLVDELLNDAEFEKYRKKKSKEIHLREIEKKKAIARKKRHSKKRNKKA